MNYRLTKDQAVFYLKKIKKNIFIKKKQHK